MKLRSLPWIFCLLTQGQQAFANEPKEFAVCLLPGGLEEETINCGENEVIDIQEARVANSTCNSRCKKSIPLFSCHGRHSCTVKRRSVQRWIWCRSSSRWWAKVKTNVLYIKYVCYEFKKSTTATPNQAVTDTTIDIVSPDFPCDVLDHRYDMTCTINGGSSNARLVKVWFKLVVFETTPSRCQDKLSVLDGAQRRKARFCSSRWEPLEKQISKPYKFDLQHQPYEIRYEKQSNNQAGKFWIHLEAHSPMSVNCAAVDFKEYERPCSLFTTSTTTTTSGTTTTTANSITTTSNLEQQTLSTTTTTITTEMNVEINLDPFPDPVIEKDNGKSKSESDSSIPGIIGGVVGLVILIGLIVLIVCLIRRRKKTQKDAEAKSSALTPSAPPEESVGVYSVAAAIDGGPIGSTGSKINGKLKSNYDNVAFVGDGEMYATVDKNKKEQAKAVNDGQKDETIMYENNELYTTSDDVKEENEDDDDVMMYENEDLYEGTNDNKADNKNTDEDQEKNNRYEHLEPREKDNNNNNNEGLVGKSAMKTKGEDDNDSVIMYENNELYSSSVDLTEDEREMEDENEYENTEDKNENEENIQEKEEIEKNEDSLSGKDGVSLSPNSQNAAVNRQSFV